MTAGVSLFETSEGTTLDLENCTFVNNTIEDSILVGQVLIFFLLIFFFFLIFLLLSLILSYVKYFIIIFIYLFIFFLVG